MIVNNITIIIIISIIFTSTTTLPLLLLQFLLLLLCPTTAVIIITIRNTNSVELPLYIPIDLHFKKITIICLQGMSLHCKIRMISFNMFCSSVIDKIALRSWGLISSDKKTKKQSYDTSNCRLFHPRHYPGLVATAILPMFLSVAKGLTPLQFLRIVLQVMNLILFFNYIKLSTTVLLLH